MTGGYVGSVRQEFRSERARLRALLSQRASGFFPGPFLKFARFLSGAEKELHDMLDTGESSVFKSDLQLSKCNLRPTVLKTLLNFRN